MIGPTNGKQATNPSSSPIITGSAIRRRAVLEGPVDQREVQDRHEQDQQVYREAEAAAFDPEVGERGHQLATKSRETTGRSHSRQRRKPGSRGPRPAGHEADHPQHRGALLVHLPDPSARTSPRRDTPSRSRAPRRPPLCSPRAHSPRRLPSSLGAARWGSRTGGGVKPSCRASEESVAGGSARGHGGRHEPRPLPSGRAAAGASPRRPCRRARRTPAPRGRSAISSGRDRQQRAHSVRVVGPVEDREGVLGPAPAGVRGPPSRLPPRTTACSRLGHAGVLEVRPRGGAGECEVALLELALGAQRPPAPRSGETRAYDPGPPLGGHPLRHLERLLVELLAEHQHRAIGAPAASFSSAMWRTVGPSQRVCSRPTFVSTVTGASSTLVAS